MLNGTRYFAEFPDEDPLRQRSLCSPQLMATLRALEKELRPHIPKPLEAGIEAGDPAN
jgi:hypothetical protein